jgi:uncharacterized protein (TIGR02147 family)
VLTKDSKNLENVILIKIDSGSFMKPITMYTDYRAFLREVIRERKLCGLPCSNRWFAMKMKINSSSWLTSVLQGKKGLSKSTANRLSAILKQSVSESRYFETLVAFNQARTIAERNFYYQDLVSLQKFNNIDLLDEDRYDFYSNWFISVVRALIGMFHFRASDEDFNRLASMICPPVAGAQVRKSVALLEKLKLIHVDKTGFYKLSSNAIKSKENTNSLAISNFQLETMRLAQEALDRFSLNQRYIGTATVGISEKTYEKIREILIDASNRIAEIANMDTDADRVYQINIQAFPMSRSVEKIKISSRESGNENPV